MKSGRGLSAIIYLLVAVGFLITLIFIPYPHYNVDSDSWYLGSSIGTRLVGTKDEGIPLDQVVKKVTSASISSPLEIDCVTSKDCLNHVVQNQCKVYCGNGISANKEAVEQLNKNRVCDSGIWRAPTINCSCIQGKCVELD